MAKEEKDIELTYEETVSLLEAVSFYADPDNYFAVAFLFDRPCGEFADDFSETDHLGSKPGKLARETLEKIIARVEKKETSNAHNRPRD